MTDPSKDTLRHEAIRHRDRISIFNNEDPDAVCASFFDNIKPQRDQAIAFYWPKEKEFDPTSILERALKDGYKCALPVMQKGERVLRFARWQDGDILERGPYNVQQPLVGTDTEWLDPDIVIVPLLAFDRKGFRLGYGGGYYDSTLRALRDKKKIIAVGVGYAQQAVIFNLPVEDHDERLDWVLTPTDAHYFGGKQKHS